MQRVFAVTMLTVQILIFRIKHEHLIADAEKSLCQRPIFGIVATIRPTRCKHGVRYERYALRRNAARYVYKSRVGGAPEVRISIGMQHSAPSAYNNSIKEGAGIGTII